MNKDYAFDENGNPVFFKKSKKRKYWTVLDYDPTERQPDTRERHNSRKQSRKRQRKARKQARLSK